MNANSEIRFSCPHCETRIKVKARRAGSWIRCPVDGCGFRVLVPTASATPAAPPTRTTIPRKKEGGRRHLLYGGAAGLIGLLVVVALMSLFVASKSARIAHLEERLATAEKTKSQEQANALQLEELIHAESILRKQHEDSIQVAENKRADIERQLESAQVALRIEKKTRETAQERESTKAAELAKLQEDAASHGRLLPEKERPDCYYLSVGVDNYAHVGRLNGCLNDARNIAGCFQAQQQHRFAKVSGTILLDGDATQSNVARELSRIKQVGKRGDFVVLFLSGHGDLQSGKWIFLPSNFHGNRRDTTSVTDMDLLHAADHLAVRGLKTVVIVDACFAGHVRHIARKMLNNTGYSEGGIILMMSSMPSQTSKALGAYSAFAQSVCEALHGKADLDGDGYVTLREVRRYAYHRTSELCGDTKQDGECDHSLSISENMRLVKVLPQTLARPEIKTPASLPLKRINDTGLAGTKWRGHETLQNYGELEFRFNSNNAAVMVDLDGTSNGSWTTTGTQVRVTFFNGTVTYNGAIQGDVISGTAGNGKKSWTWKVARIP